VRIRAVCLLGLLNTEYERNALFETSIIMYQSACFDVPNVFKLSKKKSRLLYLDPVRTAR